MRTFFASAVLIALVLIGQQWVAKGSEAQDLSHEAPVVLQVR